MTTADSVLSSDCFDIGDWGDFADSEEEGSIEEKAEHPDQNLQGVYYPICIGDILAD